jgi:hypothetical protein
MQNVFIKYNNQFIPSPTPLVTMDTDNIYYNQYWGKTDRITLQGQITGLNTCSPFASITSGQSGLLNIFNKNFGLFEIYEYSSKQEGYPIQITLSGGGISSVNGVYTGTVTNDVIDPIMYGPNGNYISQKDINFWFLNVPGYGSPYRTDGFLNSQTLFQDWSLQNGYYPNPPTGKVDYYKKIYENSGIIVKSISFDQSNYAGIINYTVELNSMTVTGNVIDPTNEYSFTENEDKTISLSHNVSAKGINTSLNPSKSNAIDNAISFVTKYTGLANIPTTKFISGVNNKFYLQNFSESIDRLNAVYSIQENYTSSLLNTNLSGNLSYTLDVNSGANSNIIEINIKGDYKGPRGGDINNLRNTLNITGLVSGLYSGYFNKVPVQYNINENIAQNLINFNYSFDNVNLPNPYYKYQSNISRDELQQVYNIQIQGDILTRGNRSYRYFLATGNLINLTGQFLSVASGILTGFKDFNGDTTISNLRLLSISIQQNPNEGTVSATANYDDKFMPSGVFVDATYNVNVDAPRWYMNNQPTCNIKGYHIINDFDVTTLPRLSLNTSFKYKDIKSSYTETGLRQMARDLTEKLTPLNYNFVTRLQDPESFVKKYNNFSSTTDVSYKLDKIDLTNQSGLLPKFNTPL